MNIGSAKPHWQKALAVLTACFSVSASAAIAIAPAPTLDNTAYVVMDFESGRILSQVNAEQPLPPASLTKMMTSYIVEQA
jgi:D-alanyl-D-alanine carboxypeptidase (penicillin-binding protein 5/6)